MRITYLLVLTACLCLAAMPSIISAQSLGESGGSLAFNVSAGSSQSMNYTIFDSESVPINFTIIPPSFNPVANATAPTVIISELNGTLLPQEQKGIEVTVEMPSSDNKAFKWDGLIQVIAQSRPSSQGGSNVEEGLGKEIIIYSKATEASTTAAIASTAEPTSIYTILTAALLLALAAAAIYLLILRKKETKDSKKPQDVKPKSKKNSQL
jgi:hypothetical protein